MTAAGGGLLAMGRLAGMIVGRVLQQFGGLAAGRLAEGTGVKVARRVGERPGVRGRGVGLALWDG